jgi:hypothetical protein
VTSLQIERTTKLVEIAPDGVGEMSRTKRPADPPLGTSLAP